MEPHLFVFAPESNSQGLVNSISGQSYYFALKGNFRIQVNQNEFILNQNDSFYFNSGTNHIIHNIDKTEAQLLWVSTNPIM
jgi:quercetin dioxygenase-like cupin family protein